LCKNDLLLMYKYNGNNKW